MEPALKPVYRYSLIAFWNVGMLTVWLMNDRRFDIVIPKASATIAVFATTLASLYVVLLASASVRRVVVANQLAFARLRGRFVASAAVALIAAAASLALVLGG